MTFLKVEFCQEKGLLKTKLVGTKIGDFEKEELK